MSPEDLWMFAHMQLADELGTEPSLRAIDKRMRRLLRAALKQKRKSALAKTVRAIKKRVGLLLSRAGLSKAVKKDGKGCPPIHFISGAKSFLKLVRQPECISQPIRFGSYYVKRIFNRFHHVEEVSLPWGCTLDVRPTEYIGRRLVISGIFDLCVSEVLWRLLGPGHHAVDVGANIGYMSSIMAARVGKNGLVTAFEPHPELYRELVENVHRWERGPLSLPEIMLNNCAASNKSGEARLEIPKRFAGNRGLCSLVSSMESSQESDYCTVQSHRLDDVLRDHKPIQLLKIDVEGHELEVLQGCSRLIQDREIVNIIFEDLGGSNSASASYLGEAGYELFYLGKRFSGLEVGLFDRKTEEHNREHPEGASYLATLESDRALLQLGKKGWSILNTNLRASCTIAEQSGRLGQQRPTQPPTPSERQHKQGKWSRDRQV